MAGIVGYAGRKQAAPLILDGLRRLEYGGYDAASLAVGSARGIHSRQATGKLRNLETAVRMDPVRGTFGVGHIRWASGQAQRASPPGASAAPKHSIMVAVAGDPGNLDVLWDGLPDGAARRESTSDAEALAMLIQCNPQEGRFARRGGAPLHDRYRGHLRVRRDRQG